MQFENILVVCTGNICRSPLAEAWMKRRLAELGKSNVQVRSAGLDAPDGAAADHNVCELLAPFAISLEGHRSRQIDREMLQQSDLILVMDAGHKRALEASWPFCRGKVYRIGEWSNFDVFDPYRKERKVFEEVFTLIAKGIDDWLERLFPLAKR